MFLARKLYDRFKATFCTLGTLLLPSAQHQTNSATKSGEDIFFETYNWRWNCLKLLLGALTLLAQVLYNFNEYVVSGLGGQYTYTESKKLLPALAE
jgi:hypothetical protein